MTLGMYSNGTIQTCFSLTATCNLHLNTRGQYNHLGGCSHILGDHVSSVGPVPVTVDIAISPTCNTEKDVCRRLYSELYYHRGGCSRILGDHVSSVGPVPVHLPSTTPARVSIFIDLFTNCE